MIVNVFKCLLTHVQLMLIKLRCVHGISLFVPPQNTPYVWCVCCVMFVDIFWHIMCGCHVLCVILMYLNTCLIEFNVFWCISMHSIISLLYNFVCDFMWFYTISYDFMCAFLWKRQFQTNKTCFFEKNKSACGNTETEGEYFYLYYINISLLYNIISF